MILWFEGEFVGVKKTDSFVRVFLVLLWHVLVSQIMI